MPVTSMIIDNVSVAYSARPVISDISLEIKSGEMFGLIGLNGAGKTTLIKCIVGLRTQNSGKISIFGAEQGSDESKKQVCFLPEKFEPPWFLTGLEFLRYSLDLYKKPYVEADFFEAAALLAFDEGALRRRVYTYSKGMRQKLGLMGTLLTGCPLVILDEPMSGLDPLARARVKKMILKKKMQGQTIFLSSHILADMDEICDRVAILHDGAIRFVGRPVDFKRDMAVDNLERAFLEFVEKKKAA